jgi:hypothetical protein
MEICGNATFPHPHGVFLSTRFGYACIGRGGQAWWYLLISWHLGRGDSKQGYAFGGRM